MITLGLQLSGIQRVLDDKCGTTEGSSPPFSDDDGDV